MLLLLLKVKEMKEETVKWICRYFYLISLVFGYFEKKAKNEEEKYEWIKAMKLWATTETKMLK